MIKNKLAVASVSLGQHESHSLPQKIIAAAQNGFLGMEMVYSDLEGYAKSLSIPMLDAADKIKTLCFKAGITIISLAPFENFEGYPSPLEERLRKANHWLGVARALGAEYIQIPSSFDPQIIQDHETIVSELRQLSDLASASEPVIKLAYENLAWSKHCNLWQDALQIVNEVNKQNFGLCLDTFHLSAHLELWGDPYSSSGRLPDADERLEVSLQSFVKNCTLDKIFYVQLSDGERMDPPYSKSHPWHDLDLEVGHVWSMQARPFPLETELGAYMPVERIARAFIVETGFAGWVSLETFDRRMRKAEHTPTLNARRAGTSWRRLKEQLEGRSQL